MTDRFDEQARRAVAPATDAPTRPQTPPPSLAQRGRRPIHGLLGVLAAGRALRAVLETAVESGGERMMTADYPRVPEDATERAARILARALAEAQRVLNPREEPSAPLEREAVHLRDVSDRLDSAARMLAGQVERLAGLLDRLEQRERPTAAEPVPPHGWPPSQEPSFPLGEVITLVVSAVPGFQGLMDVQRALSGLDGVEGASVRRYQGGEATIELVLARPMTAGDLASGIREATHHRVVVEEAQPETLQLHLRCLAADA